MKNKHLACSTRSVAALAAITMAMLLAACGGGGDDGTAASQGGPDTATALASMRTTLSAIASAPLSNYEASSLVFMREEEKLARDVYAAMYARWGTKVFGNIGESEQMHMDAVAMLLTRYGLPDPAATTQMGVFGNAQLQALYEALVVHGNGSPAGALEVGAEIEELDIRDLRAIKATVDNADLLLVYDNLEKGSRNHLRAFHENLVRQGLAYVPKYISPAEYDAIVNSPREQG